MLKWLGGSSAGANSSNGAFDNLTHVGKVFSVNEYQVVVEEVVAEGGFSVVYKARSPKGHLYALKRMAVNNEQDLFLAKQEIAITKALSDCPNSVTFISSSIHPLSSDVHEVLILLELYMGQSVVDLLNSRLSQRSNLTEEEVWKVFSDVLVAVGRLHHRTKPIIHRDLKIENILSDLQNNFVLCDYGSCTVNSMDPETMGAAKCEDEIARFTTMAYRAPEMVSLYSGKVTTTKADIWALGCLLYKLCFMTTPFGERALAIVSARLTIPQNSLYSEDLHSLIRYMLEADPDQRPTLWQVSEVLARIRGTANPLPNVFRSSKPPASLPRALRENETKTTPTASSNSKTKSTPVHTKTPGLGVTTTSISSRERPRARGSSVSFRGNSSTTSTPVVTIHETPPPHPQQLQQQRLKQQQQYLDAQLHTVVTHRLSGPVDSNWEPPHTPSHFSNRSDMGEKFGGQHSSISSKSLDSGLDVFGAVPFSSPREQVCPSESEPNSSATNFTGVVRRDLFGSTPFYTIPSPASSNARPHPSQLVDEFGAPPFVTCS